MLTESLIYFTLAALFAEILGTIGGFGSSLFFVPLAGFFLDFQSVLGITAVFHLASNASKIALFRNGFDAKLVFRMGIPSVLFVIGGSVLSKYAASEILEMLLGIFLVAISLVLMFFKQLVIRPTTFNAITGGILSGFTAGLLGTGGAIRGLTLTAFNLEKDIFITTSAIIDLGIDLSRSVVYFSNGFLHQHDLYLVPVLILVSLAGTFIGKKILFHFSQSQFKHIVLSLILVIGVVMLSKTLFS